jgi:hypothetical protein
MFQNLSKMHRKPFEIATVAVLVIGIVGYAGIGLAVSASRVATADRTLNTVVSHQNTLNSTFRDINTQLSQLSSDSAFNPQQAVILVDKSIFNTDLATKTINADEVSLRDADSQLRTTGWLTLVGRSSLDREATRITHARYALAAASTIASDEGQDGRFWHYMYAGLSDLTTLNTQAGGGDFSAARSTLGTMKLDIDQAAQLSTAPGLPKELHSLMTDLQAFVSDYGKQLDAQLAGDDASVVVYQSNVATDLEKVGGYNIDQIGKEITTFYKPLIDQFNSEIAAATA